jgi:class III poly(R)-hydroxyalkanoic acid synthase PhaE subunit
MDQAGALQTAAPWKAFIDGLGMGSNDLLAGTPPAFGLSREYQEISQRLLDLGKQFQQRCGELTQRSAIVMQDAFHIMQKRIEADGSLLKSPPDLYDEWIECAEACYAQAARGDAFAHLFAELCNLASAIKVERGKLVEQIARQLDLPSRAEVDTLNRQIRLLTAAMPRAKPHPKKRVAPARKQRKQRKRSRP